MICVINLYSHLVMNNDLPKKIWFLWLQGLDDAPLVVKKCYESWVRLNPDWEVVFFDEHNIADHVELPRWEIPKYVASELLRINLLAKHGGVWVDATCFCVRPLDEWLPQYMDTGFFAFEKPGPDRMISSWFLAAYKDNYIAQAFQQKINAFWHKNKGLKLIEETQWPYLHRKINKHNTNLWFNPVFIKILKVHPYFWFHYLFAKIYSEDSQFRELWDASPKFDAAAPCRIFVAGLDNAVTQAIKTEIDQQVTPVYKLTWKYDQKTAEKDGSVQDYLFRQ